MHLLFITHLISYKIHLSHLLTFSFDQSEKFCNKEKSKIRF